MTIRQMLFNLRPGTLAQIAAELLADFADEDDTGEFHFRTGAAKHIYNDVLAAGKDIEGEAEFAKLVELALAYEDR